MARTEEHFIWTGDYADRINQLARAVAAADADIAELRERAKRESENSGARTLDEVSGVSADLEDATRARDDLAAQYQALKDEAESNGLRVVLRGLNDEEWYDIVDNHPPRTEDPYKENDAELGFNERTGTRPFLLAAMVDPEFGTRAKLDAWVTEKGITRGDLTAMMGKAWALTNGMGFADPKSLRLSPTRAAGEG